MQSAAGTKMNSSLPLKTPSNLGIFKCAPYSGNCRLFTRLRENYLDDDAYKDMQNILMQNPHAGAIMPGTGGLRKFRYADRSRQKGKRGGLN